MATPIVTKAETVLNELGKGETTDKMPVIFIGHGNPMHALNDNAFTKTLNNIQKTISKPKAILVVSAHWLTRGTFVSTNPNPKTIYDFGGFPEEMYKIKYEPIGAPELAKEVKEKITHTKIEADNSMGLDHGAWTILKHMYPAADIPTFQLSVDYYKPASYHFELAKQLGYLRNKGVLIIGSGNLVHNLGMVDFSKPNTGYDWAIEFDATVKNLLDKGDFKPLLEYEKLGKSALLSIPTNDHYLPMIYPLGLKTEKESLMYLYEGMEAGSISMRSFVIK
ncbi:MAG: 4,5-DOPA dioxygenase extradiol [Bacteroidia bacterium]|nr:4,5-DOPA dioxygenase extradiol [Bacteroidia bacterium]